MTRIGFAVLVCLVPLRLIAAPVPLGDEHARAEAVVVLQSVADELRGRLEILERVVVSVVEHNPLVMSVETLAGRSGPFVIAADAQFVDSLTPEELRAAIAHELGHVWIYTHHPYHQTERLANDVAMRVTSADVLVPVYHKVWQRTGVRGDLADFISFAVPSPQ